LLRRTVAGRFINDVVDCFPPEGEADEAARFRQSDRRSGGGVAARGERTGVDQAGGRVPQQRIC